jgi:hypothetical protein
MKNLYRATVTPSNPGWTDAEVSLQDLIDDGILVPVDDETPPPGWHICDCSDDCGAWEPDDE